MVRDFNADIGRSQAPVNSPGGVGNCLVMPAELQRERRTRCIQPVPAPPRSQLRNGNTITKRSHALDQRRSLLKETSASPCKCGAHLADYTAHVY
jgi:hypothetical protein